MSWQGGRLEGFGEEDETGWRLLEFVVILNTEPKVSWCLLETAGNQRVDRERRKGQRTSSIEKELSERDSGQARGIKEFEKGKRQTKSATGQYMRGRLGGVLMKRGRRKKSART